MRCSGEAGSRHHGAGLVRRQPLAREIQQAPRPGRACNTVRTVVGLIGPPGRVSRRAVVLPAPGQRWPGFCRAAGTRFTGQAAVGPALLRERLRALVDADVQQAAGGQ
jgi:hypothetical protein